MRGLSQDDACRVGADVPGDARQHIGAGAGMGLELELRTADSDRTIGGERERRGPERDRVNAQQEVVHDRVAHDRQLEDLIAPDPGLCGEPGQQAVERFAHRRSHLGRPLGMHHGVRDAAHQVLAEPDLRIHRPVRCEDSTVGKVRQMPGDCCRTDIDRNAVCLLVQAWPDGADRAAVVDPHGDSPPSDLQGGLEIPDDMQVRFEVGQSPLRFQCFLEAPEVAGRGGELRLSHLDVVKADDRVDVEVADVEVLANDLAVDLALRRDIDDDVASETGDAREATGRLEAATVAVLHLGAGERRQVFGARLDPVLGEAAHALLDLAAAADPAPPADRVDVDAEPARRVQDGRA